MAAESKASGVADCKGQCEGDQLNKSEECEQDVRCMCGDEPMRGR